MSDEIVKDYLKKLYLPSKESHKGQNGRLLIIGGSCLFHSASLWALEVASRIVDLVHYSSVSENNRIVQKLKEEFRNGIVVPRSELKDYIKEDDCILIGPGMVRTKGDTSSIKYKISDIKEIEEIEHEGMQTYFLTKYLLTKYKDKKWVIDAGALQMMEPDWIPKGAILTPHKKEFKCLISKIKDKRLKAEIEGKREELQAKILAKKYGCIFLIKGTDDNVCSYFKCRKIEGGNAGMTKGGTGDVLAGLVAGLYCKNEAFVSSISASYINKKAGDRLFTKMGYWFNASDLAMEIPKTMRRLLFNNKKYPRCRS